MEMMRLKALPMDLSQKDYISPKCRIYELKFNTVICGSRCSVIDDVAYEDLDW
jgi:hypothetical protein